MIKNNEQKFLDLKALNLPLGQYAITGSGPMGIRNLREIGDIDIIVSLKLWNTLSEKHGVIDTGTVKKIALLGEEVEALGPNSFYTLPISADDPTFSDRITNAEIIDGLPFESLEHVIYYKRKMGREKDLHDIQIIQAWQNDQDKI